MRKQIELLEYHSDLLTHMVNVSFRRRDVNALEVNFFRRLEFPDGFKERRNVDFSGTGRTDNGDNFSLTDLCADSV